MAVGVTRQQNIAVNAARNLIFFEGSDICYNYKTQQWTDTTAYAGLGLFSLNSKIASIGIVYFSSGSVQIGSGATSHVAQTAIITTGAVDPNQGGRTVVNGVRPRANGGTHTVRVGVQDTIGGAITWSSAISPNSRTNMANFRSEGRYIRVENTIAGGFTTSLGADVDFSAQGRV